MFLDKINVFSPNVTLWTKLSSQPPGINPFTGLTRLKTCPPATIFKIGNESIQRSHNLLEHLKSVWDMRVLDS